LKTLRLSRNEAKNQKDRCLLTQNTLLQHLWKRSKQHQASKVKL